MQLYPQCIVDFGQNFPAATVVGPDINTNRLRILACAIVPSLNGITSDDAVTGF